MLLYGDSNIGKTMIVEKFIRDHPNICNEFNEVEVRHTVHLQGDQYVIGDDHQLLIKVGARPNVAEAYLVATPTFRVPEFVPEVMYNALSAIASNWHFSK